MYGYAAATIIGPGNNPSPMHTGTKMRGTMNTLTIPLQAVRALLAVERGEMSWRAGYRASGLPLGSWLDLTSDMGVYEPVETTPEEEAELGRMAREVRDRLEGRAR